MQDLPEQTEDSPKEPEEVYEQAPESYFAHCAKLQEFEHYAKLKSWTPTEAVSLLCGQLPGFFKKAKVRLTDNAFGVDPELVPEEEQDWFIELERRYAREVQELIRAAKAGFPEILNPRDGEPLLRPLDVLQWAKHTGIAIDEEFQSTASEAALDLDLPACKAKIAELEKLNTDLANELAALKKSAQSAKGKHWAEQRLRIYAAALHACVKKFGGGADNGDPSIKATKIAEQVNDHRLLYGFKDEDHPTHDTILETVRKALNDETWKSNKGL